MSIPIENFTDPLSELESIILDCYLKKGYKVGLGNWNFKVQIDSLFKLKKSLFFYLMEEIIRMNINFMVKQKKKFLKKLLIISIFKKENYEYNKKPMDR